MLPLLASLHWSVSLHPVILSLGCVLRRGSEDKCPTCLVHQCQGWLVTKPVPGAASSSLKAALYCIFWLAHKALVVLWTWPLPAAVTFVPRAVGWKALTCLLWLSGYPLKQGSLCWLVRSVWGSIHTGTTQLEAGVEPGTLLEWTGVSGRSGWGPSPVLITLFPCSWAYQPFSFTWWHCCSLAVQYKVPRTNFPLIYSETFLLNIWECSKGKNAESHHSIEEDPDLR